MNYKIKKNDLSLKNMIKHFVIVLIHDIYHIMTEQNILNTKKYFQLYTY